MAMAVRHLTAHGQFAAAGNLSLTAAAIKAVDRLALDVTMETERRFVEWFHDVSGTSPSTPRR